MSANKYNGELVVEGSDKKEYFFKSSFDFLVRLKETSNVDPMVMFTGLMTNTGDPKIVLHALSCSLQTIEGKEVEPSAKVDICKSIIEEHGYQEASIIAQELLIYAMIGSKKKSQLDLKQEMVGILDVFNPFQLKNLKKRLLLWVLFILISGVCVCIISKLLEKFIALNMG